MTNSTEQAIAAVEAYATACTETRVDDIAALFAEDAELRDPYDGDPVVGRDAIRAFFEVGAPMIELLAPNGPIRVSGDARSAAAPMLVHVDMGGTKLEMDTVDVFFFDADGRISAMHGFYGPSNVRPKE